MQVQLNGAVMKVQPKVTKDGYLVVELTVRAEASAADIGRLANQLGKTAFVVISSEQMSFDDLLAQASAG